MCASEPALTMSSSGNTGEQLDSPLQHEAVLNRVLQLVGPGHSLFIASTAQLWHDAYRQIRTDDNANSTTYAAVLASESRLLLACNCGFDEILLAASSAQRIGRAADLNVLQLALSHGLPPSLGILRGAMQAGALDKVQYLWLWSTKTAERNAARLQ